MSARCHIFVLAILLAAPCLLGGCSRPAEAPADGGSEGTPSQVGTARGPSSSPSSGKATLVVQGEVVVASKVPEPGTAPYTECLTLLKYRVLSVERGKYDRPELLAAHWGMRDNQLMPAASYKPGDKHRLELEPLEKHPELERVMQADDTNDYDLTPYWVVGE